MAHELELRLPPQPVVVTCDCMRIEQVANNLISNAIKYSPGGGRVMIDVAEEDGEATLTVRDEGVGIDTEDLEVIFDPFRRAQRAAGGGVPGVGIGLYISRLIVEAHGGRIEAHSTQGRGSQFRVVLRTRAAPIESEFVVSAGLRQARANQIRYGS